MLAAKDVQYLPIHVFNSTGGELEGYTIVNVVTRIAALDYDKTDFGLLPLDESEIDPESGCPKVRTIRQAALKRSKLRGHDMVRLAEYFPLVFVSERFAEVYDTGMFTGATLEPVIMV